MQCARLSEDSLTSAVQEVRIVFARTYGEELRGNIHWTTVMSLLLCGRAIAGLKASNTHVSLEIGVRHARGPNVLGAVEFEHTASDPIEAR